MRLSLRDLLIAIFFVLVGAGIASLGIIGLAVPNSPFVEIVKWGVAVAVYLTASSLLYNRLRWRPML